MCAQQDGGGQNKLHDSVVGDQLRDLEDGGYIILGRRICYIGRI